MAAGKETTGLNIALIIFVMLTIILSVTTFIFFKENEQAQESKIAADQKYAEEENKRKARESDINELKQLVGKGPADPIEDIMTEFKAHQQRFAATYSEDSTKVYPAIFETMMDSYLKLQDQVADYKKQVADLKASYDRDLAAARRKTAEVEAALTSQTQEILRIRSEFDVARKAF